MKKSPQIYDKNPDRWTEYFGNWFMNRENFKGASMENSLYPYTALFEPVRINTVTAKNRIVMAPMGNLGMADETGKPGNKMIRYFAERAKGGTGLITSGLVPVSHVVDPSLAEKNGLSMLPRVDQRSNWAGWRTLSESIHSYGALFFMQLTAGMGRVGSPECLVNKHKLPVSASWNPNFYIPQIPSRPLGFLEIRRLVKNTGQAAANARELLVDGVYLHGHEGYLLEQMSNPAFNRRLFGPYRNWQRFGIDLVREIRKRCGSGYPVMYRIDLSLMLNATYNERMKTVRSLRKFRNERTIEMTLDYIKNLVAAGVDIFDIDLGCYDNWWLPHPPEGMPPASFIEAASIVKKFLKENNIKSNAGLDVPVVGVGKLGFPDIAESVLRSGDCDMVMLGRPLLADPEWPNKVFAGKNKEIIPCIGDQEGCLHSILSGGHIQCTVNPRTSFEDIFETLPQAKPVKSIAVAGAGPAGVMCACTAAERGHNVTVFESKSQAGGMLIPGSVPAIKFEAANYVSYMRNRLSLCAKKYRLRLRQGKAVTAAQLKKGKFDCIVIATGGRVSMPDIPGIKSSHVHIAIDVLNNRSICKNKRNAVIIGGGSVGCETAHFLACELGIENVTVVEMQPVFMKGLCTANRGYLIHYLDDKGVQLMNCATVKEIKPGSVLISRNVHKTVPDPKITWAPLLPENIPNPFEKKIVQKHKECEIEADIVIVAMGLGPDRGLYEECLKCNAAPEIYLTGDVNKIGSILEATRGGYAIGRRI